VDANASSPVPTTLSIRNLVKKYKVRGGYQVPALNGVSLELGRGEMLSLFGPNGAGKTTLVRIIAGLLSADSGTIEWPGNESRNPRSLLGYVSQKGGLQYGLTCREEMTFHVRCFGLGDREAARRVERVTEMLHCGYLLDWNVDRLSGGQRRVVEVGMALLHEPAVILLDEPTLGLDPATRLSLWETVGSARRESDAAFLVTTHYIDEVAQQLSNVSVINHGTVIASGTPEELQSTYSTGSVSIMVPRERLSEATQALQPISPDVYAVSGKVVVPAPSPDRVVTAALQALEGHGIRALAVAVRKPSLNEAFLALTSTPSASEGEWTA
jgi:ABC-2 type transport system ATP-binding protein